MRSFKWIQSIVTVYEKTCSLTRCIYLRDDEGGPEMNTEQSNQDSNGSTGTFKMKYITTSNSDTLKIDRWTVK